MRYVLVRLACETTLDGQSDPLDLYPFGLSADVNVIPGQDILQVRNPSEMEVPVYAITCSVATRLVLWRRPRYTLV